MRKYLTIMVALSLSACVTPGSVNQGLYATFGSYAIAVHEAANYAEGPTAQPSVVIAMNNANQRPEVQAAARYGQAFILCQQPDAPPPPSIDCTLFDFKASTAQAYATTLRGVTALLLRRN